jgi:Peptidase A4 family
MSGGTNKREADEPSGGRRCLFPPTGFDATRATQLELDDYCLPMKPDPKSQPALSEAWQRMFEPPLNWVRPEFEPILTKQKVPQVRQLFASATTRYEDSRNWCGAEIVPHGANQFVQIFGEWAVPNPTIPPPYDRGPQNRKNVYKSATWIGLDGDRRYLNSSLPQVGTIQYLTVDPTGVETPEYFVFFQWWARDQIRLTLDIIRGIQINAGTSVIGLVWAIDPTHVLVVFRTFAPLNQITVFLRQSPDTTTIRPIISGATAEWIMERPTALELGSTTLELFPSYDKVYFKNCVAGMARTAGQSTSEEVLKAPRLKRMFEVASDAPSRTRFISIPNRISTTSFSTHYGDI